MIIKHGCVEVYMLVDGNKFVVERLFDGSVINFRQVIIEDYSFVFMRALTKVQILSLPSNSIEDLAKETEEF